MSRNVLASDVDVIQSRGKFYAVCAGHEYTSRSYATKHAAGLMARQHEADESHFIPEDREADPIDLSDDAASIY